MNAANWRKIAITPTMPVFAIVGEIACLQQLSSNYENRGFSSAVSIPPVLPVCAAINASAKSVRGEAKKPASNG
jgi:hypothetical protein